MREIKFKYVITHESGDVVIHDKYDVYMMLDGVLYDSNHDKVNGFPIQYTGLLDRNGKEIYEGDIIEYYEPNYDSSGGLIDYNADYLVVKWNDVSNGFDLILDLYIQPRVIGNIYENPNLVK